VLFIFRIVIFVTLCAHTCFILEVNFKFSILSDDHMAIKFQRQSRKGLAGTIVKVLPVVLQEHLSNRKQNGVSQICAEKIPLR